MFTSRSITVVSVTLTSTPAKMNGALRPTLFVLVTKLSVTLWLLVPMLRTSRSVTRLALAALLTHVEAAWNARMVKKTTALAPEVSPALMAPVAPRNSKKEVTLMVDTLLTSLSKVIAS